MTVMNTTSTVGYPPVDLHQCPDNDYDGRCGVETSKVVNRCIDNDRNTICEFYLATDGIIDNQREGPAYVVENTTVSQINTRQQPIAMTTMTMAYAM